MSIEPRRDLSPLPPSLLYKQLLKMMTAKLEAETAGINRLSTKLGEHGGRGTDLTPEAKDWMLSRALDHCEKIIKVFIDTLGEDHAPSYGGGDSKDLDRFTSSIDPKSRKMVRYLIERRHAGIRELADLIGADSDMEVLSRIRELINPRSAELLGHPLLSFHHSKMDPLTGEKVFFSWWISGCVDSTGDEALIDVFKEDEGLRCIVYPPSRVEDFEVDVKGNLLALRGRGYCKLVQLPYQVVEEVERTRNNGVLDIRLSIGGKER